MQDTTTSGAARGPFYVAKTGNDAADGSKERPVATVGKGLSLAAAAGGGDVLVAVGHYDEAVVLPAGVTLRGGYSSKSSSFDTHDKLTEDDLRSTGRAPEQYASKTVLTAAGHPNGGPVVRADDAKGDVSLEDLVVIGPAAAKGQSSYAVVLRRNSRVRLSRVKLVAGDGGRGEAGGRGLDAQWLSTPGGAGGVAQKVAFKHDGGYSTPIDDAISGSPGTSTVNAAQEVLAHGGSGGHFGKFAIIDSFNEGNGEKGQPGTAGASGHDGAPGRANPDRRGSFDADGIWSGEASGGGGRGIPGAGGGGGGPGGSIWQNGSFTYEEADRVGGAGGNGGRGGTGGEGGDGGQPGGGSFGLVVLDTVVEGDKLSILQGRGGDGGDGGQGGAGHAGEGGADGSEGYDPKGEYKSGSTKIGKRHIYSAGFGGPGGSGGAGGPGGGGAGGNGGPSMGIVIAERGTFSMTSLRVFGGRGGRGGQSATGEPGSVGECRAQVAFEGGPMVPVYDDFDPEMKRYQFSARRLPMHADWVRPKRPAFYAFAQPVPGTMPIRLEVSMADGTMKYQLNTRSAQAARDAGWTPLGIAFYAYRDPAPDRLAVHVETPENARDSHYYYSTRSAAEAHASEWLQLGVGFYVPPAPAS